MQEKQTSLKNKITIELDSINNILRNHTTQAMSSQEIANCLATKIETFCSLIKEYRELVGHRHSGLEDMARARIATFLQDYNKPGISYRAKLDLSRNIEFACSEIAGTLNSDLKKKLVAYNSLFYPTFFSVMDSKLSQTLRMEEEGPFRAPAIKG